MESEIRQLISISLRDLFKFVVQILLRVQLVLIVWFSWKAAQQQCSGWGQLIQDTRRISRVENVKNQGTAERIAGLQWGFNNYLAEVGCMIFIFLSCTYLKGFLRDKCGYLKDGLNAHTNLVHLLKGVRGYLSFILLFARSIAFAQGMCSRKLIYGDDFTKLFRDVLWLVGAKNRNRKLCYQNFSRK